MEFGTARPTITVSKREKRMRLPESRRPPSSSNKNVQFVQGFSERAKTPELTFISPLKLKILPPLQTYIRRCDRHCAMCKRSRFYCFACFGRRASGYGDSLVRDNLTGNALDSYTCIPD